VEITNHTSSNTTAIFVTHRESIQFPSRIAKHSSRPVVDQSLSFPGGPGSGSASITSCRQKHSIEIGLGSLGAIPFRIEAVGHGWGKMHTKPAVCKFNHCIIRRVAMNDCSKSLSLHRFIVQKPHMPCKVSHHQRVCTTQTRLHFEDLTKRPTWQLLRIDFRKQQQKPFCKSSSFSIIFDLCNKPR
jgi:hypothetical protein